MGKESEGAKDALMELCKWRRPHNPLAKYSTRDVEPTAVYPYSLSACTQKALIQLYTSIHVA